MYMCTDYIQNTINKYVHEIHYLNMCTRDGKTYTPTTMCNVNDSLTN